MSDSVEMTAKLRRRGLVLAEGTRELELPLLVKPIAEGGLGRAREMVPPLPAGAEGGLGFTKLKAGLVPPVPAGAEGGLGLPEAPAPVPPAEGEDTVVEGEVITKGTGKEA